MRQSRLVNRNVMAARGRTSMRLEPELWEALLEICEREGAEIGDLIRTIEDAHPGGSRTSAVRVYIVAYFRRMARVGAESAEGHVSGHRGYASALQDR